MLDSSLVGAWRSLVAHQSGGLVVVGSNPAAPTNLSPEREALRPGLDAQHRPRLYQPLRAAFVCMNARCLVRIFAVLLTAQLTLAACDLAGVAPPGSRQLIVPVENLSAMPVRLFVAEDEGTMGRSVGTAVPGTVPPGVTQVVVFSVPPGTGWAIFVNPTPMRGPIITAGDVPPGFSGATPLAIYVAENGELSVSMPGEPGWFGQ